MHFLPFSDLPSSSYYVFLIQGAHKSANEPLSCIKFLYPHTHCGVSNFQVKTCLLDCLLLSKVAQNQALVGERHIEIPSYKIRGGGVIIGSPTFISAIVYYFL